MTFQPFHRSIFRKRGVENRRKYLKKIEELTNRINADLLELRKLQGKINKRTAAHEMYELYQNDRLLFVGTKAYLAKRTGLSLSTINTHCKPGILMTRRMKLKQR